MQVSRWLLDRKGALMSEELTRFSVSVPQDLLESFDNLVERRGMSANRSEAIRDLIRAALVEDECGRPGARVMGTLTIVYNHHANDLKDRLDEVQHAHFHDVISTMHVHLDAHNCLEIIVMRGESQVVQDIAHQILGTKGVKTGKLVLTTVVDNPSEADSEHHRHHHE